MNLRFAVVQAVTLLACSLGCAQDRPKVEVTVDYSYFNANAQDSEGVPAFSFNGGGVSAAVYFKYLGIVGEFEGYGTYKRDFTIPSGTYCGSSSGCSVSANGNLFTYNIGPIVKFRTSYVEPFVEALFGGAHSNFYGNLYDDCVSGGCLVGSKSPSNNGWDYVLGGGIDIPVITFQKILGLQSRSPKIAIRPVEFDYVVTHFNNVFTSSHNNQSNWRLQAGAQLRLGGPPPPPANRPPVASCSANPATVFEGSDDVVAVSATASDPDNDTLTYTWSATGGKVDGTGPQVRWSPTGVATGSYTVTANVSDGRGGTVSCTAEIRVEERPNRPPTISCSVDQSSVRPGDHVRITATASDPDNDPLTFTWQSNGGQIVGSGAEVQLDTTGLAAGSHAVTGHVDDGRGGVADCQAQFSIEAPPPAVEAKLAIRSIYFPTALPSTRKPDEGLVESQQRTLTSPANDFKEYLASKPNAHLELQGHADHRGTPEYNQALSERRVELAKRFLVGLGIPEANLVTKAYGEEDNMTPGQVKQLVEQHPNLTQEQKNKILSNLKVVTLAQNRRVDITLSSSGQQSIRQFPF